MTKVHRKKTPFYYVLKDKIPVPCEDVLEWGLFMENIDNRKLAYTDLANGNRVSTIFLGINLSFCTNGNPPLQLFATQVFNDTYDSDFFWLYDTYDGAIDGHKKICDAVLKLLANRKNVVGLTEQLAEIKIIDELVKDLNKGRKK